MSQKYYIGRDWFFYWAHVDSNDDPVDDFGTNTYYVTIQEKNILSSVSPLARIECTKTIDTGELYAELSNTETDSFNAGTYVIYYEVIDSSGRLIGLADREITVEHAPDWEV